MRQTGIVKTKVVVSIFAVIAVAAHLFSGSETYAESNGTIIDLWGEAKTPSVVELQRSKLDPEKTAFLILDIEERTCNRERRPRCLSSVPNIRKFLDRARKNNVFVVYSLTSTGTPESILADVAPTVLSLSFNRAWINSIIRSWKISCETER